MDPAFAAPREAGRDKDRPFIPGGRGPAALALELVGAQRVSAEEIEMRTWGAGARRIEVKRPFTSRSASSAPCSGWGAKHGWSYGAGLGRNATGQWSNMAEGSTQPPLPPALRKVNWREFLQILQTIGRSDYHAARTRMQG